AVVELPVGDAEALGEADPDPDGTTPGAADPEGEADPVGEAEPDALGDAWAFDRGVAVAADDINMSKPVINDNAARMASTRGAVLRMRPPFCIPYSLPHALPRMHGMGGFLLPNNVR